eukprot:scaffold13279_cov56-Phaeocystis_antarctica.AAC.1
MERPVCCASALIRLVLPVPGGPCSSRPSLCGTAGPVSLGSGVWLGLTLTLALHGVLAGLSDEVLE